MRPAGFHHRETASGQAMILALGIVLALTAVIAAAILYSGTDVRNARKQAYNANVQAMTESTLQFGREFFTQNYASWPIYLTYFVPAPQPKTFSNVSSDHPELIPPFPTPGYNCFIYARDDDDELPPAIPTPQVDNNLRIFVGANCTGTGPPPSGTTPLHAELVGALEYNPPQPDCQSQFGGGTQGVNNCSVITKYR